MSSLEPHGERGGVSEGLRAGVRGEPGECLGAVVGDGALAALNRVSEGPRGGGGRQVRAWEKQCGLGKCGLGAPIKPAVGREVARNVWASMQTEVGGPRGERCLGRGKQVCGSHGEQLWVPKRAQHLRLVQLWISQAFLCLSTQIYFLFSMKSFLEGHLQGGRQGKRGHKSLSIGVQCLNRRPALKIQKLDKSKTSLPHFTPL